MFAARPWNCNRAWRGEHKPIIHTDRCCHVYREAEKKIKSGYFIATPRILQNWIKLAKLKELGGHKTVSNVNVKVSVCLIKDTVLGVYGGKEEQLYSLVTTTLDGAEWSASRVEEKIPHLRRKCSTFLQIHFSPRTSTLCQHWVTDSVDK